ncbi:Autophagy protein 7 [Cystobasidiomycetes sp. EMM_F5]
MTNPGLGAMSGNPANNDTPTTSTTLTFTPFASSLAPDFWVAFAQLKVDVLKLDDRVVDVAGHYSHGRTLLDRESGGLVALPASADYDGRAFGDGNDDAEVSRQSDRLFPGRLHNFNTVEAFRASDKQQIFASHARELWSTITSPSPTAASLNISLVITFADLKKYIFYYWFAFPAFLAKPAWVMEQPWASLNNASLHGDSHTDGTKERIQALEKAYNDHVSAKGVQEANACILQWDETHGVYRAARLSDSKQFWATNMPDEERILLFVDPSSDPESPGWVLRNYLAHLYTVHNIRRLRIIRHRATWESSLTCIVSLPISTDNGEELSPYGVLGQVPPTVGWEKNLHGKLAPRMVDLGGMMDPKRLADQAVDLNLKLMRWRILPALNLEVIAKTKCLLLGAGTLGCYVSRNLMAWGVWNITLVDSGKVSFSNPVRQPLFELSDCLDGGKPKAQAAADALKRIYPSVNAVGVSMAIPMPGHPVPPASLQETRQAVESLEKLMDEHDVVFLLMDSRESRWLPTMLGAAKSKSLSDRTLDQMCTVTRPGLAAIASATAVELMTSTLQHPLGPLAPAENDRNSAKSVLGAVPHTIRGFLSDFNTLKITGQAYSNCTACSDKMVNAYREQGFELLRNAFDDAKHLERVTGLDKLQEETEKVLQAVEWEEDEDDADAF